MKINTFFLRVAASCNLDCDYCYVFKHRDMTWKNMPAVMLESTVQSFAKRLRVPNKTEKQSKQQQV